VSSEPAAPLGSRLNDEQRRILAEQIERIRSAGRGDISSTGVRVGMLWELYLLAVHGEAEAAAQKKASKTKASSSARRKILKTLKDHLGRAPTAEDLVAHSPALNADEALVQVLREDIEGLQRRAPRRSRLEILDERIKRLQGRGKKR
jgi:hypothetical protein